MDFLALVEQDTNVQFLSKGHTKGGEFAGPCPWCGGEDRFVVWPNHPSGKPEFMCRQCGKSGDAIQYLRDRHDMSFHEAKAVAENGHAPAGDRPRAVNHSRPKAKKPPINYDHPTAVYDYRDVSGNLVAQVCRFDWTDEDGTKKKTFSQRVPQPGGGWAWKKPDEQIPYRMHEINRAALDGLPVVIVEGEKCADALAQLGLVATTSMMGAMKWPESFSRYFTGLYVTIVADEDRDGHRHAEDVARKLWGYAAGISLVHLPDLEYRETHGLDVYDWLQTHSAEELYTVLNSAPAWAPENIELVAEDDDQPPMGPPPGVLEAESDGALDQYELTDDGNARRLVKLHGHRLRYSEALGWLVWSGRNWEQQGREALRVHDMARDVIALLYQEASAMSFTGATDVANEIIKHAKRTQHVQRIRALVELAKSLPGVAVSVNAMDAHPHLLNCLNGTVDLRTGELREHDPADNLTHLSPVEYHPQAQAPRWRAFLEQIMAGNAEMVDYLQLTTGYGITGDVREQCFFLLYGTGANGKSTYLEVIRDMLGGGYSRQTPLDAFLSSARDSERRSSIVRLKGARFASASEAEEGKRFSASAIKQLTGGDTINARQLYAEEFEFKPTHKLFFAVNHRPTADASDGAMWRRMRLIPFTVSIPEDQQDRELKDKLLAELPGILAWAVEGAVRWYAGGLPTPPTVLNAIEAYREEMDEIQDFITACCVVHRDARVLVQDLYKAYVEWVKEADGYALGRNKFNERIRRKGFEMMRQPGSGQLTWRGIGLSAVKFVKSVGEDNPPGEDLDELLGLESAPPGAVREICEISPAFAGKSTNVRGNGEFDEETSQISQISQRPETPPGEADEQPSAWLPLPKPPAKPYTKPEGPRWTPPPTAPPVWWDGEVERPGFLETEERMRRLAAEKARRGRTTYHDELDDEEDEA
jgi:putative DNA primase/helicase